MNKELICFNGKFYEDSSKIKVSPFLPSIQFGASVFETFRTYDKARKVFNQTKHLIRLFESAEILGLKLPPNCTKKTLNKNIKTLLEKSKNWKLKNNEFLRFKIFVNEDYFWIRCFIGSVNFKNYKKGVEIQDTVQERVFPAAKTGQPVYFYHLKHKPFEIYETIFFSKTGFLTEGNVTNIFIVIDRILYTPKNDILPGVMRGEIMKIAKKKGYKIIEQDLVRSEVLRAQEIFLTNTINGIIPVKRWGEWKSKKFNISSNLRDGLPF